MKLILLSCAFICGVYLESRTALTPAVAASLLAVPLFLFLTGHKRSVCLWMLLCLVAVMGGALVFQHSVSEPTIHLYNEWSGVHIRGSVENDPTYNGTTSIFRLSAQQVKVENEWSEVSGTVLVFAKGFATYSSGDELLVTGRLEIPQLSIDDHSKPGYNHVESVMFNPSIDLSGRGELSGFRNRLSDSLTLALSEPEGSLAQALLLGIRSHVPDYLADSFRNSGTAHIMAISGLHVAILGGMVLSFAAWVLGRQRPTYIVICLVAVWLYALLTGMHCPAYRAAIMFSLFLVALWIGRPHSALPSIAFAAAVIVGTDPAALWEASFQLSFVAVIGIVLILPYLQRAGRVLTESVVGEEGPLFSITSPIVTGIAVTLAAIIATFPLIAYYFEHVSLVGLPATLAVLPALPGVIVTVSLVAVAGLFAPFLAEMLGWIAWLFLAYVIEIVQAFASLPFASTEVSGIDGSFVWGYYGMLFGGLWMVSSRKRFGGCQSIVVDTMNGILDKAGDLFDRFPKKQGAVFVALLAALIWAAVITAPDKRFQVSFLDVGQGDAIFITTPSGEQILIDGGPDPEAVCVELGERLPFWDKSLDLVILTHPDDDHIAGLIEVLHRYDVEQVLESGLEVESAAYEEWLALIKKNGIEHTVGVAGQEIDLGNGIMMDVLHPSSEVLDLGDSSINNSSMVLCLRHGEVNFLLTGDIEQEVEDELRHSGIITNSTVLKIAHHGSNSSTTSQFLEAVDPEVAVISVGEDNPFGHPRKEVVARLDEKVGEDNIYLTSQHGTITFITNGERLWVETAQ